MTTAEMLFEESLSDLRRKAERSGRRVLADGWERRMRGLADIIKKASPEAFRRGELVGKEYGAAKNRFLCSGEMLPTSDSRCGACLGGEWWFLERHHKVPLSYGGLEGANLVLLCEWPCHKILTKYQHDLRDFAHGIPLQLQSELEAKYDAELAG